MEKFEYKIFNKSEADAFREKNPGKAKTWLDILNDHGQQGWQVRTSITNNSYLMMRRIDEKPKLTSGDNQVKNAADFVDLDNKSIY